MTERIAIEPARPHAHLQPLPDLLFWDAWMSGFFICYGVALAVRCHREHQTQQVQTPEAVSA
ncbi:hypothetical protein OG705_30160 [Streptomyces sp. NBC_00838]|uniref:hypothetical protein n=1 Tax=Streptomyces sp. NBC_00838 TaxID=2903680 RepID=UPI00386C4AE4|nr:hypothetical protein OG705_30160 [Streptomyces sp. NBC_00838]